MMSLGLQISSNQNAFVNTAITVSLYFTGYIHTFTDPRYGSKQFYTFTGVEAGAMDS
jgi:hypothetical protein